MDWWRRLIGRLRKLLTIDTSAPRTTRLDGETLPPESLERKVLLVTFDPRLQQGGGQRLSRALGWYSVGRLIEEFIADLRECSGGLINFQVVERNEVETWPSQVDGFSYDETSYLAAWRSGRGWHSLDTFDYEALIDDLDLLHRVESGQIDEVWLFGFPYAGFYESIMVGPGAFWCNSPPIVRSDGISRRFVIMGFNYERDVGPMLESFGHRFESHLKHAWRRHRGPDNLWESFILYDKIAPGQANCGWMHYAPNSQKDYDWGNPTPVFSNCDDWLNFPHFRGQARQVDCRDWGNGDMRAHHKWWFHRLPKAAGTTYGISNNWWLYGVDPNAVT